MSDEQLEEVLVVEVELIGGPGENELVGHWMMDRAFMSDDEKMRESSLECAELVGSLHERQQPHRMSAYFLFSDGSRKLFQRMIVPPEAARDEDFPEGTEHYEAFMGLPLPPFTTDN